MKIRRATTFAPCISHKEEKTIEPENSILNSMLHYGKKHYDLTSIAGNRYFYDVITVIGHDSFLLKQLFGHKDHTYFS